MLSGVVVNEAMNDEWHLEEGDPVWGAYLDGMAANVQSCRRRPTLISEVAAAQEMKESKLRDSFSTVFN